MANVLRIQGKVIHAELAKTTGYYVVIRDKSTGKRRGMFSQWKPQEKTYSLTLRQDRKYFFVIGWQELEAEISSEQAEPKAIHQPYETREKQAESQLIQTLQAKIKQLTTEAQQWKNAYYNQKSMLKEAQQNAHQRTVQTKIKAIQSKPGRKSKQDLDYLKLLGELSQECEQNWAWLNN